MVGIVSYGAYVPSARIKTETIAQVWNKNASEIVRGLGVFEKSVPAQDEDAVTLAIEAAQACVSRMKPASNIEVLLVGSESHPYSVNPTSTIVGEFLNIGNNYLAADLEFACKAGTAAVQLIVGLLAANKIKYGLAIGSDTAQSRPHDALEYSAGSAAVALCLGNQTREIIAELINFTSFSSDTPDFWRRDGIKYPSHGGRFTGKPAYFAHVEGAAQSLLKKTQMSAQDFDYCVFHMPNAKFPQEVAKRLGFTNDQLQAGFAVPQIGNPYSASSLLGLVNVLEQAKPNQTIFMVSYGSGAGSDAFIFKTTQKISKYPKLGLKKMIEHKKYIDYSEYLKRIKAI